LRLLVTGAEGFTGKHFFLSAVKAGYEVFGLQVDLLNYKALETEVLTVRPDVVVHLAAVSFVGGSDKSAFYSVNVVGTTNLLDAILKLPRAPTKVLLASSANIYGNSDISPIAESATPNPINHYAVSKLAMEKMALTYSDKIPIVITRPFNYTGYGQHTNFIIPKLVSHFVDKKSSIFLGNINVEREFNDIDMVCEYYLILIKYGVSGENYNVCSGKTYSLATVIELLSELTGQVISVNVSKDLVRSNEVINLCGDPYKLDQLIKSHSEAVSKKTLKETLQSMM